MKMIVISDTHHDIDAIRRILPIINECDTLVHLGDCNDDILKIEHELNVKEIVYVRGNCDYVMRSPEFVVKEWGGAKFFFTHGHRYRVDSSLLDVTYAALENECNYVFYGHTHIADLDRNYGVELINPGSVSRPRAGYPSYAIVEKKDGKIFTNIVLIG